MSHTDYIANPPRGFKITAHTENCPVAAMENSGSRLYAVQFHPEVVHTPFGTQLLRNFVMDICGCTGSWKMSSYVETTVKELREKIGDGKVLLGLSGGVDSSVAAALLAKATPGPFRRRGFLCSSSPARKSNRKAANLRLCGPRTSSKR